MLRYIFYRLHNINLKENNEKAYTVEPRDNGPAFKGEPSIKVNIFWSQLNLFNVILPFLKGEPELKVRILKSQWD